MGYGKIAIWGMAAYLLWYWLRQPDAPPAAQSKQLPQAGVGPYTGEPLAEGFTPYVVK